MTPRDLREVVARKRDGVPLSEDDIRSFVDGHCRGEVSDELASAFLMAAYIRGLTSEETVALTGAYVDSGRSISFDAPGRPVVDKHSTGGVADGVTLVFAPLAASVGLAVAKLSGRGLGHTGGTLDKLESIPGFRTDLSPGEFRGQVEEIGCAIVAQSADVVPADGALYALRDATATVDSVPLIAASVMSKKLAVDSRLILLDVKAGSGAFTKTRQDATELARTCVRIGQAWARPVRAAITDMSQPLGHAVGNALDVAEAISVLRGQGGRVRELSLVFVASALRDLGSGPADRGMEEAERALDSGAALERFRTMVSAQGGDPRVVDEPERVLPRAPVLLPVRAASEGFLAAVDTEALGRASGALGAGRAHKGDAIDSAVGVVFAPSIGDLVQTDDLVATIHAGNEHAARVAADAVRSALTLSSEPATPPDLVLEWLE